MPDATPGRLRGEEGDVVRARLAALRNPVRTYDWGSRTAIASLQGRPVPTDEPEAELWVGAHGSAPSRVVLDEGEVPLDEAIAADPKAWLGADVAERYGPRLPFLLKVLAAERPLSLQAHPDAERAAAGFAREQERGIALDARERNYRDPWHKPELLRALGPFDALCGFRDPAASHELFAQLGVPDLAWLTHDLEDGTQVLAPAVRRLLTLPDDARWPLVGAVADACDRLVEEDGPFAPEAWWGRVLAERHPGDPGVVVALLLDLVQLEAGEAIQVPPGTLHAYLEGVGVEVMAASDNTLRGGLTTKHVDVEALLEIMHTRADGLEVATAVPESGTEVAHRSPAPDLRLSELRAGGQPLRREVEGPQLLLCSEGIAHVEHGDARLELRAGETAVVPGGIDATEVVVTGPAYVFRVAVASHQRT